LRCAPVWVNTRLRRLHEQSLHSVWERIQQIQQAVPRYPSRVGNLAEAQATVRCDPGPIQSIEPVACRNPHPFWRHGQAAAQCRHRVRAGRRSSTAPEHARPDPAIGGGTRPGCPPVSQGQQRGETTIGIPVGCIDGNVGCAIGEHDPGSNHQTEVGIIFAQIPRGRECPHHARQGVAVTDANAGKPKSGRLRKTCLERWQVGWH
jgi:hypothetical protein